MRRHLNKAVAAIIATAMIMTSAGSVYADEVMSSSQDGESVVSEVESADQNISDEADDTDTEEIVSDGEVQAESTVTEGTEEVTSAANETSGTCGDNLTWTYDEATATLTISGTGDMEEFDYGSTPWNNEASIITKVVIETGVTSISACSFMDCSNLTSINIPESVISIGASAFSGCSSLTSIELPSGITGIGSLVFSGCSSLKEITIPNNVVMISYRAFSGCESLQNITFAYHIKEIDGYAFDGCSQLTDVYYKGTEAQWNAMTIEDDNDTLTGATVHYLDSSDVESSITGTCGDNLTWSFNENDGSLIISGIGEMDDLNPYSGTFHDFPELIKSVKIENGVTSIGSCAFAGLKNMISIEIPSSVATIGIGAFEQCFDLVSIDIPSGVTSIKPGTFDSCSSLASINIPASVTTIGSYAFSDCRALENVYFDGSENQWNSININTGNDSLTSATIHYSTTPISKPQITSQPVNTTTALKAKATFSVSAENVVSYQWQYSKNNGSTWSNLKDSSATSSFISGATTDTLTILTTNTRCGYVYRCQLTGENGDAVYTDTVTLSKIPELSITTQPVDTVGSLTKRTTFTVVAENAASYQWQYSKNGGTSWNTLKDSASSSTYIGGCTTDTLTLLVNSTRSGYVYRCKVTGQDGTVKYTDQAAILLFTITTQPESVQAKSGNTVTFSVGAENAESYQWYYQKEGSTTWNKLSDNTKSSMLISGSTTDTLKIKMTKTRLTFKYRCKVKGLDGTSKYTDTVVVSS